ncbi:MAG: membrane protein insertion efficiency factor YidD [Bacteroidales bacterium]
MHLLNVFKRLLTIFLLAIINFYRYAISPWTPKACRHIPTCSKYAAEAVQKHGPLYGSWLSLKRLAKCHPWGTSGYDPVPDKTKN